ncbi:MAG TPA: asparagine synthase (glutamine-hydrolyzing) [Methanoregulaceae archaeon]|nr:asparagine synthase (glutamine-hydrolyzing) [Methanoregulaceae archaeon]HRY75761.1 asparagine synthase (glutamine-hydrolyzing) [Methanoregulaceae archaeon]
MCGIAGQLCYGNGTPDSSLVAAMARRLAHRGPDGEGSYNRGRIALAHRRLSIIDLSDDACQPMTNEDGSLRLVFNGEIYNYVELREELERAGHRFTSKSDSEVILHAYEEWRAECPARFNGMGAFAIWDEARQELFCSRDRFGIKPFYYAEADGSFLFASEIKALLAHPGVGRKPDEAMLHTYLAWGVSDHTSRTMFEGISQLPPAHSLIVGAEGMRMPERYWSISVNPSVKGDDPDDKTAADLLACLRAAVGIHLRSDVPVGTCLSGGIDSSVLAALINDRIRKEVVESVGARQKTFSAVFSDERYDESRYIGEVVATTGVDASAVSPSPNLLREELPRLVYMQDEPFGSLSIYAQYCVMRLAAGRVKVVLDGQGADELFAGYLAYEGSYIRGLARSFHWYTALRETIGAVRNHAGFFTDAIQQLIVRSKRRDLLKGELPEISRYAGSLDKVLHRELTASNLPALLHYEDRNSMAFSIESRVPFLDVRLAERIAALPLDQKIRNGITKHLLRRAAKGLIPESVRCRKDKMGFVTPEEVWMKGELLPLMQEIFTSDSFRVRPYWDADAVGRNYRAFTEGRSAYSFELFRIACTELWLRQFFDARETVSPPVS